LAIGLAPATAHAATNAGGGAVYAPQPSVAKVQCVKDCAPDKRIQGGSTARITGQNLSSVTKVVFQGAGTKGAAKAAAPKAHTSTALIVTVPIDAQTGPIKAMTTGGVTSDPSKPVRILPPPPPEAQVTLTPAPGAPALETATSAA
jgi:hypothetical protein